MPRTCSQNLTETVAQTRKETSTKTDFKNIPVNSIEAALEMLFRLFKKVQVRGARRAMSGSVLMYVDAKSIKRNEADEPFSPA